MIQGMLRNTNIPVGEGSKPGQTSKTMVAELCWDAKASQPNSMQQRIEGALGKIKSHMTALGYGIQGSVRFSKSKT